MNNKPKIVKANTDEKKDQTAREDISNFSQTLEDESKVKTKPVDDDDKEVLVKVKPGKLVVELSGAYQEGRVFRTTLGRAKKIAGSVDIVEEGDQVDL